MSTAKNLTKSPRYLGSGARCDVRIIH